MIDMSLIDTPVNTDKFKPFNKQYLPCLFLGFDIKNEYDNQRLTINKLYKPQKLLFIFEKNKDKYEVLPLYGLFLPLNKLGITLCTTLVNQELSDNIDINIYSNILAEYNMSCIDSYTYLNKRIYPIDLKYFSDLTDHVTRDDKKILQHLLNLDDNKFDFQKFGAFKLLILS